MINKNRLNGGNNPKYYGCLKKCEPLIHPNKMWIEEYYNTLSFSDLSVLIDLEAKEPNHPDIKIIREIYRRKFDKLSGAYGKFNSTEATKELNKLEEQKSCDQDIQDRIFFIKLILRMQQKLQEHYPS